MKQTKRFAVVGSDARQAAAGRALARAGYTVGGVQQLPQADYILLPLPLEQHRQSYHQRGAAGVASHRRGTKQR